MSCRKRFSLASPAPPRHLKLDATKTNALVYSMHTRDPGQETQLKFFVSGPCSNSCSCGAKCELLELHHFHQNITLSFSCKGASQTFHTSDRSSTDRSSSLQVDHLQIYQIDYNLPSWDVVRNWYDSDPTQEPCPRSCSFFYFSIITSTFIAQLVGGFTLSLYVRLPPNNTS